MKKTKTFFACVLVLGMMASCGSGHAGDDNTAAESETTPQSNFSGIFTGMTPCADCPGIYMITSFSPDGSYYEHMRYIDRDATRADNGTWTQNDAVLTVKYNDSSSSSRDFYFEILNDSTIRMLDQDKKPVNGSLAEFFILHKKDTVIQK